MTERSKKISIRWALSILCLAALSAPAALAGGACVSADIDEPFRLPDGSVHAAGRLSLCLHSDYSPVASFHLTKVDGMPISLYRGQRTSSESDASVTPFIMFARASDGRLELLGYAHPGADDTTVHAFARAPRLAGAPTLTADAGALIRVGAVVQ